MSIRPSNPPAVAGNIAKLAADGTALDSGVPVTDLTEATSAAVNNTIVKRDETGTAAISNLQASTIQTGQISPTNGLIKVNGGLDLKGNLVVLHAVDEGRGLSAIYDNDGEVVIVAAGGFVTLSGMNGQAVQLGGVAGITGAGGEGDFLANTVKTNVTATQTMAGGLALPGKTLYLANAGDQNHRLVYNQPIDGPILSGASNVRLQTAASAGKGLIVNSTGSVVVDGNVTTNSGQTFGTFTLGDRAFTWSPGVPLTYGGGMIVGGTLSTNGQFVAASQARSYFAGGIRVGGAADDGASAINAIGDIKTTGTVTAAGLNVSPASLSTAAINTTTSGDQWLLAYQGTNRIRWGSNGSQLFASGLSAVLQNGSMMVGNGSGGGFRFYDGQTITCDNGGTTSFAFNRGIDVNGSATFTGNVDLPNADTGGGVSFRQKDQSGTPRRVFYLDGANNYGARNEAPSGNAYYGVVHSSNTGGSTFFQAAGSGATGQNVARISPAGRWIFDRTGTLNDDGTNALQVAGSASVSGGLTVGGQLSLSNGASIYPYAGHIEFVSASDLVLKSLFGNTLITNTASSGQLVLSSIYNPISVESPMNFGGSTGRSYFDASGYLHGRAGFSIYSFDGYGETVQFRPDTSAFRSYNNFFSGSIQLINSGIVGNGGGGENTAPLLLGAVSGFLAGETGDIVVLAKPTVCRSTLKLARINIATTPGTATDQAAINDATGKVVLWDGTSQTWNPAV